MTLNAYIYALAIATFIFVASVVHAQDKTHTSQKQRPTRTWTYMVVDGVQCRTDGHEVQCGVRVEMPAHTCTQVTKLLTVCAER